jgi:hypothetical protein
MANVHPKIVQERLGHANIATTMDLTLTSCPGCRTKQRAALMPPYEPRPASGVPIELASTTLADLFMPLLVANPFSAMRASPRR